ncbi:DUF2442 domain-containing protein [Chlorobium sp. KB01]|uniref:DUF2442 domain-containing protein n=1 Tax=Chlorobium sp. KB01 TaxID=1917528 RepID=UPI00097888CE|nr:DUF2442 domain-containing protein [Chlorobium sp. KB01]
MITPDVVAARYIDNYRLELVFEDGKRGIVDFCKYLEKVGVFEKLKNPDYFKNFSVSTELGVVTWNGEVDIAPEVLYSGATGVALPEWVEL